MKKVTIKDIAREAGVSVATVSYVLNNRTDQKISEATKAKVLQIVNLFNYQSNNSRNLASGVTKQVALFTGEAAGGIGKLEEWSFIAKLRDTMVKDGYHLVIQPDNEIRRIDNVDAIICHGTTIDFFRELSQLNFVPVIAVDLYINDTLFFQINSNYRDLIDIASDNFGYDDFTVVFPEGLSPQVRSVLRRSYHTISVGSVSELTDLLKASQNEHMIVYGANLAEIARAIKPDIIPFDVVSSDKMDCIWDCCQKAIGRQSVIQKHFEI
ncbi:MAG TPA: LacI family DNA-binding transcriptional regulator [Bacilli bacterium]|nr:LacI family DNA-binding transcriptional regulator [Bacilli bacterium]